MKLRFTTNATRRLGKIADYHRDRGNAKKGKKTVRQIQKRAKELEKHPLLGPTEEYLEDYGRGHRSLLVGTLYKIVYLIAKPLIIITDIFDVQQDPDKMKP